ncbi:MAG: class I SAM-dependent methyltransferase [Pseudomonadota bacterium]
MSLATDHTGLSRLYALHAARWHDSISRLGYPDAYRLLTSADRAARSDIPKAVLDAGCGTGAFAEIFAVQWPEADLTLLDPSPEMLAQAKHRDWPTSPRVIQGGLSHLQAAAGNFDTILCAHVLEHLPDFDAGLDQLCQSLKPGGSLLLSVSKPHWCTALLRWRWGHKAYRPEQVCKALDCRGLTDVTVVPFRKGPPSRTSSGYRAVRPV